jgi:3-phosphoshikimate 1-carboxyvinyltransferase
MSPALEVQPAKRPIDAVIELPGSKSYTNRALLIAALADGRSTIRRALFSDDTRAMHACLAALGIAIEANEAEGTYAVEGQGGRIPASTARLDAANAGTAARFLTAAVTLGNGRYIVDGSARMRERPIEPLLDGLRQLGCVAYAERDNGCPPVVVEADGLRGGPARIRGDISSQYLSALLMVAPFAARPVDLEIEGELVSAPYIRMTSGIMQEFGVELHCEREGRRYRVPAPQRYAGREYIVEPDASAASYFFAAAAVTGGRVLVRHLGLRSVQGDLGFVEVLERMGCRVRWADDEIELQGPERLRGIEASFDRMGDVATTLAAIAPFADGPVTIRGIAQTHYEECDRPVAAATELRRMAIAVEQDWDTMVIHPGAPQPATIETYDDHRMAMSFAVTGLCSSGIRIANPACVAKTFPAFFERLAALSARPG